MYVGKLDLNLLLSSDAVKLHYLLRSTLKFCIYMCFFHSSNKEHESNVEDRTKQFKKMEVFAFYILGILEMFFKSEKDF